MDTLTLSTAHDIREARLGVGLSQEKLGALTNIRQTRISAYERGATEPSLRTLAKIGAAIHAHIMLQKRYPEPSRDQQLREKIARRLFGMGDVLTAFQKAHPEYSDLALPLAELLRTAQASITVAQ